MNISKLHAKNQISLKEIKSMQGYVAKEQINDFVKHDKELQQQQQEKSWGGNWGMRM